MLLNCFPVTPREEKSSSFDGRNADAAVEVGTAAAEGGGGFRAGGLAFEADAAAALSESCLRIGGGVAPLPIIKVRRLNGGFVKSNEGKIARV